MDQRASWISTFFSDIGRVPNFLQNAGGKGFFCILPAGIVCMCASLPVCRTGSFENIVDIKCFASFLYRPQYGDVSGPVGEIYAASICDFLSSIDSEPASFG
eukprot:GEMP01033805.1.p2 GENE.GEMP01033805.1~~GEMP01033805.1.p2  ORF type:complete len:102 (-),score=12.54 GEMP01033805.1:210-515(-)